MRYHINEKKPTMRIKIVLNFGQELTIAVVWNNKICVEY